MGTGPISHPQLKVVNTADKETCYITLFISVTTTSDNCYLLFFLFCRWANTQQ